MKISFPLIVLLSLVLTACGAPTPISTPPVVTSLPDPTTLSYEPYDPAVIGIILESGESRTIHTTDDKYFTIFFAGKNGENYVGYISQWNGFQWSDWTEVAVTAEEITTHDVLNVEAETRTHIECMFGACFGQVDWYTIHFDGVRSK